MQSSRCDLAWSPRRMGSLGHRHWQETGPRSPKHQSERARAVRVVSHSPAGSASEDAGPSGRSELRRDRPSLPASGSPTRNPLTPGCDNLRPQLYAQPEPNAEAERCEAGKNSSESREKVGVGAGRMPGIRKLKWCRVRVSCGVQYNGDTSRCRMGIHITHVDVGALSSYHHLRVKSSSCAL